jgi:putative transcriptional regulator
MSRPRHANQVRAHRKATGMTQGELAAAIGAGRVTIVRIEQGQQVPDVHRALKLADVLGATVEELFSGANTGANTAPKRAESRFG